MAKKRQTFPWTVLGIDKTNSVPDIKRGYAAKLKVTRPDDDPEAFQRLVNARDVALHMASNAQFTKISVTPETQKQSSSKPRRKVKRKSDVATTSTEALSAVDVAGEDDGNSILVSNVEEDFEFISTEVDRLFASKEDHPDTARARRAMSRLSDLSIAERQLLEPRLLENFAKHIQAILYETNYMPHATSRARAKGWLVNELDKTFGWSENDRRARELTWLDNEDFGDQLQLLLGKEPRNLRLQPVQQPDMPFWQKGIGWIVLTLIALRVVVAIWRAL